MPLPLAVAAPAAIGAAAYINAKAQVWYDLKMLTCVAPTALSLFWRERTGRLSLFYDLEYHANHPSTRDKPLLLFESSRWTFRQVLDESLRYGTWLHETFGIKKDDVVAMDFANSPVFIFVWMGLWSIGAKPAFINYNLSGQALVHCVRAANSLVMLIDPAVAPNIDDYVRTELADVRLEFLTPERLEHISATKPVRMPDEVRADDGVDKMAVLIYTSGTTGLPKAAVVSSGKVLVAAGFSARLVKTRPGDVFYTCMPLYHSTGSLLCFANALLMGATVALGPKFSTHTFWREVRQHKATIIQYVGETLRYLLAAPAEVDPQTGQNLDKQHTVRVALGNGLRPDVWNRLKERFGIDCIAEFYGSTEGNFATWNLSRNDFSMGAVGRNGWLYSLFIGRGTALVEVDFSTDLPCRDPKTGLCKAARSGEPGEILFRLPDKEFEKRFQGYYNDSTATNKKVLRDVFHKGDVWFRTGDVMRWDSEGRLYFHDRIGDTFRWKGENVSTAEVSQVLGLLPAVQEANVYGVQLPNHDGRAGCAALVIDPALSGTREEVLRELARHARRELPRYAVPIFLRITSAGRMATTGTNKQQKHDLRAQGVEPCSAAGDELYWLEKGEYVPFTDSHWDALQAGRARL